MKTRIEWEAHAYEYKERSSDWFWAVGIVAVALALTAAIFGNIILGILILVAAFTLALFINREPHTVEVSIDERGVTKAGVLYPFESLHSFWIDSWHSHPRIYLRSEKPYVPLILVPLGGADPDEAAGTLSQHISEEHHELPLVERLLERIGF
ncbi:hypothetical protein KW784_00785 [Candidatus Parcubacteria bacterium]|nr:hypothetical protein [Candidatus Parcubacteria bacterium]